MAESAYGRAESHDQVLYSIVRRDDIPVRWRYESNPDSMRLTISSHLALYQVLDI